MGIYFYIDNWVEFFIYFFFIFFLLARNYKRLMHGMVNFKYPIRISVQVKCMIY